MSRKIELPNSDTNVAVKTKLCRRVISSIGCGILMKVKYSISNAYITN
jgi:hypothetical protein